jgi:hypothetical protein
MLLLPWGWDLPTKTLLIHDIGDPSLLPLYQREFVCKTAWPFGQDFSMLFISNDVVFVARSTIWDTETEATFDAYVTGTLVKAWAAKTGSPLFSITDKTKLADLGFFLAEAQVEAQS